MASAWAIAAPIASPISSLKYGKCQFSGDSTTPSSDTISDAITFLIGASSDLVGCVLCTWWHGEGLGTSCESTVFCLSLRTASCVCARWAPEGLHTRGSGNLVDSSPVIVGSRRLCGRGGVYSPECVELEFCELRLLGILGS